MLPALSFSSRLNLLPSCRSRKLATEPSLLKVWWDSGGRTWWREKLDMPIPHKLAAGLHNELGFNSGEGGPIDRSPQRAHSDPVPNIHTYLLAAMDAPTKCLSVSVSFVDETGRSSARRDGYNTTLCGVDILRSSMPVGFPRSGKVARSYRALVSTEVTEAARRPQSSDSERRQPGTLYVKLWSLSQLRSNLVQYSL